jgi:peptidoglycan/LPS O-acetylase OafA/YrhL
MAVHFMRDHFQVSLAVGVDIFFVLSGFLVTRLLVDRSDQPVPESRRRFIFRRLARILPPLAVVCAVVLPIAAIIGLESVRQAIAEALTAISSTYLLLAAAKSQTGLVLLPVWSLSVEMWFYLLWPLLLVRRNGQMRHSNLYIYIYSRICSRYSGPSSRLIRWPVGVGASSSF